MYMTAYTYVYVPHVCRGQKVALDSLELMLQFMSHLALAGN